MKPKLDRILKENEDMKEVLEDLKTITTAQMEYSKNSQVMFKEEEESAFYVSPVFQNNASAKEFCTQFKEFMGIQDGDQVFVNGHTLAEKWGKPLKSPYVTKTVNLDKNRDAMMISEVGTIER